MKTKKITVFIFCVLFAFAGANFMISCGDAQNAKDPGKEEVQNNGAGEQAADNGTVRDDLPQLDFGGYEYRVSFCVYVAAGNRGGVHFYPEAEEGEVLNDAVYRRNQQIQSRFNVTFKADDIEDSAEASIGFITKNVQSGEDAYDMYMLLDRNAHVAASKGLLYPFDDIPHIDLSKPYWLPEMNSYITIGGRLPWAFSDEVLSLLENLNAVYFNKKMVQDLGLGDIYAMVKSGEWTIDKFFEFAKAGIKNVSGNDKMTADDYWGIVSQNDHLYPNIWISAGINLVEKDKGDIPYFNAAGNEKFFGLASKVTDIMNTYKEGMYLNVYGTIKLSEGVGPDAKCAFFKKGQALFSVGNIQEMVRLRDMEDDFGVVPFPKYDAQQPRYHSRIEAGRPFVIPATNQRPEIAGAVMEAMACETRNTVFTAYYEYSLQNKFSRDPDTVEMLDLIRESAAYDICDTIWCTPIRSPLTEIFASGKDTFVSWVDKNEDKIAKNINKLVDEILDAR
ncbi:MAG: hypothetical protein FWD23_03700 [Oscillospiraceae bacterium]|nr:hypothetical protein [Oscillospiraceae bacterium]